MTSSVTPVTLLGGVRAAASGEDRETCEGRGLLLVEERVAPVERRPHRLLARRGVPRTRAKAGEDALEPAGDLLGRQQARPCRRQLDGQRQCIDALTHGRDRRGAGGGEPEPWIVCRRPRDEQRGRRCGGDRGGLLGLGQLERIDDVALLSLQVERGAAGRQQLESRGGVQQLGHERRCRQQVLEVVEHDQLLARRDQLQQRPGCRRSRLLLNAQRLQDRVRDAARIHHRGEVHERRTVGEPLPQPMGCLDREARLTDAPDADERHELRAVALQELDDVPGSLSATEQGGPSRRQMGRARRAVERRGLLEDLGLQHLQRRARL